MLFIRSLFFHIYYYAVTSFVLLYYGTICYFKPERALSGFQHWCRMLVWGMNKIANISIEIRGAEHIPTGAALIASKHQSAMETILIFAIFDKPCAVLKKELTHVPFAQSMIRGAGHIPVDRKAGAKARYMIVKMAQDRLQKGHQIVIYPEGTRSKINATPTYKRGVFGLYQHLNTPCIPIALNTGMFWAKNAFFIRSGKVIIELLPPIETGLNADNFMNELTTRIESGTARLVHEAASEQTALKRGTHPSQQG